MKKLLLICFALGVIFKTAKAQTDTKWTYDFGSASASYTGGITTSSQPNFPATQTINTYSGGNLALMGAGTGGSIAIVTSGGIGSGGRMKLTVPSVADGNGNTCKYSIYDIPSTAVTRQGAVKFQTSFEGASGDVVFSVGNGTGYSSNTNVVTNGSMAMVRFNYNTIADEVSVQLFAKTPNNWLPALSGTLTKNTLHTVEVYYNNLNSVGTYKKGGQNQNLAVNTFDLWIDNILVADDAEISGTMSVNVGNDASKIDSYMFTNRTFSSGNAIWYVDNIAYTNFLPMDESVLPVDLSQALATKVVGANVQLSWATASEQNSNRFEIWHSVNGKDFAKIGSRETNAPIGKKYSFLHVNAPKGNNYYKLVQVDNNGKSISYSPVVALVSLTQNNFSARGNEGTVEIRLSSEKMLKLACIAIIDITGRVLAKKQVEINPGVNQYVVPQNFSKGIYVATLTGDGLREATKFILN